MSCQWLVDDHYLLPSSGVMAARGALIVFEGCDRVGKSTQCRKLVEKLIKRGAAAKLMKFPDRSTVIGKQIDDYLQQKVELPDPAVHLLFAANRWELVPEMKQLLRSGTTLVIDRYAYSGVAYTAAKEVSPLSLSWCKAPDVGLPAPDVVFYLKLSPEAAQQRAVYGEERYEKVDFQKKVEKLFEALKGPEWHELDASRDVESLHTEICSVTDSVIETRKNCPIGELWTQQ